MAELLSSRYVPCEVIITKRYSEEFDEYLKKGYKIRKYINHRNLYRIRKPPVLEMVFREGDTDFVFDMMDDVYSYFKTNQISKSDVNNFIYLIISGEVKITILPDGSYTLK